MSATIVSTLPALGAPPHAQRLAERHELGILLDSRHQVEHVGGGVADPALGAELRHQAVSRRNAAASRSWGSLRHAGARQIASSRPRYGAGCASENPRRTAGMSHRSSPGTRRAVPRASARSPVNARSSTRRRQVVRGIVEPDHRIGARHAQVERAAVVSVHHPGGSRHQLRTIARHSCGGGSTQPDRQ